MDDDKFVLTLLVGGLFVSTYKSNVKESSVSTSEPFHSNSMLPELTLDSDFGVIKSAGNGA